MPKARVSTVAYRGSPAKPGRLGPRLRSTNAPGPERKLVDCAFYSNRKRVRYSLGGVSPVVAGGEFHDRRANIGDYPFHHSFVGRLTRATALIVLRALVMIRRRSRCASMSGVYRTRHCADHQTADRIGIQYPIDRRNRSGPPLPVIEGNRSNGRPFSAPHRFIRKRSGFLAAAGST